MKEKTVINEKTSNGVKKLRVLLADRACLRRSASRRQARLVVKLIVLIFAFAQMASADPTNRYVVKDNPGAAEPYDSWTNAAGDIQTAVNYAYAGETLWVSNGTYDVGGTVAGGQTVTNRVMIDKAITVRSANNDPANTIIKGAWDPGQNGPAAVRCVYMVAGSSLIGFTLTNGATAESGTFTESRVGGGVWSPSTDTIISNCVLTGNSSGYAGGGAHRGKLYNCTVTGNSTIYGGGGGVRYSKLYNCTLTGNWGNYGGGARESTLYNCTLTGNSANHGAGAAYGSLYNCAIVGNAAVTFGGGAYLATLRNCTIVGNSSGSVGGGTRESTLHNCISWGNNKVHWLSTWYYSCSAGITGEGTITNDPLFIADGSGSGLSHVAGNYRLSNNSPCINTGTNFSWMTTPGVRSKDLDGNPRIDNLSGQADMGCYEHLQWGFTIIRIR